MAGDDEHNTSAMFDSPAVDDEGRTDDTQQV